MGGLDELIGDDKDLASNKYRHHGSHEEDERVQRLLDECLEDFPADVRVDFVEVSPEMTKHNAMAYRRPDKDRVHQYMRVSEGFLRVSDQGLKNTIMHELVHLWFYQNGYPEHTERNHMFTYALGAVGASLSGYSEMEDMWKDCVEPLIEEKR